jgi:hypothetical protein
MAVVATLSKGYDLDYVWKQVDHGPVKDAAGYYLQASESGGEPPGRWWGPGAKALGLEHGQLVERGSYDLLFGQRKAPDGTPLGRPPGGGRKAQDCYARLSAGEPRATAERRRELRIIDWLSGPGPGAARDPSCLAPEAAPGHPQLRASRRSRRSCRRAWMRSCRRAASPS